MPVIGFKDWSVICAAMAQGEQSVILRKGGLAEGRDGFQFKHRDFFLYPTAFHEQLTKLRNPEGRDLPAVGDEQVCFFAAFRLEWSAAVTDWEAARALEPFHLYREEVVRERFDYDEAPGLQVAFGRALRVDPAWVVPYQARFGGCRSWIQLPEGGPDLATLRPALSEDRHADLRGDLAAWAAQHGVTLQPSKAPEADLH